MLLGTGTGMDAQFGIAEESTYGTFVAPTRFLEFNSESLKPAIAHVRSRGIGMGRFDKTGRHKEYITGAGGSIEFDVKTKNFGLLFKHMLGSYANSLVAGSERKGLITPDAAAKKGLFLTSQVGRPEIGATVKPYNYPGTKITGWEFSGKLDDPLKVKVDLDAKTEETSSALATASFASGDEIFVMSEGAITLNGSTLFVKSFSFKGNEALATNRRGIGNVKKEPLGNGIAEITGSLEFEHEGITRHGQLVAGTEIANLIATFTSPTVIAGGGPYKIILKMPLVVFEEGTANIGGPDIVPESMNFRVLNDGTNPVFEIDYHSTDTTA